jgi:hypothetical protein
MAAAMEKKRVVRLTEESRVAARRKRLDGSRRPKCSRLRPGKPPVGFSDWSLRLLAEQAIEFGIVDSLSDETLRKTLKNGMPQRKIQPIFGISTRIRVGDFSASALFRDPWSRLLRLWVLTAHLR